MKFEILKSSTPAVRYFWRIKSGNGKILAHSELYTRKAAAVEIVRSIIHSIRYVKHPPKIMDMTK
jgi:uncharacterized protein YegP (UPF0339 family)